MSVLIVLSIGGVMQQHEVSRRSRIANIIAAAAAIAGAVVASPAAMEKLPASVVMVLKTTATLGNTTQPLVVTVIGVLLAAATHPPAWLMKATHGIRGMRDRM